MNVPEPAVALSCLRAQCWICPHCGDDGHHHSDAQGCEWSGRPAHEHRGAIGPTDEKAQPRLEPLMAEAMLEESVQ